MRHAMHLAEALARQALDLPANLRHELTIPLQRLLEIPRRWTGIDAGLAHETPVASIRALHVIPLGIHERRHLVTVELAGLVMSGVLAEVIVMIVFHRLRRRR